MYDLARTLVSAPRSITGDGVRATLAGVSEQLPLTIHEVPSGTPVLDWTVPPEWNVREAWLAAPDGTRVVDWSNNPLHLLGYSVPTQGRFDLQSLQPHLYSLPDRPSLIPYRTSYYTPSWGFCLADAQRRTLTDGEYEICIDATSDDAGSLTYGEAFVPGSVEDEVLISTHVCHPAMANDNLSGIVVATGLGAWIAAQPRRWSYRILFVPGTIGSITWLARNRAQTVAIKAGVVLTGLGDRAGFTYKRSRQGSSWTDRVLEYVLSTVDAESRIIDFSPYGYDERQFCSPGFDLPIGRLTRSPPGEYPEYHTSGDNLDFITPTQLGNSLLVLQRAVEIFESDRRYVNTHPYGEPNLGRRGLYRPLGGAIDQKSVELGYLWMLSQSDGTRSVLEVAQTSGVGFDALRDASRALVAAGLLEDVGSGPL